MPIDISTRVSAIEGIGPGIETRLRAIRVHTVFDLLRGTVPVIHAGVREVASETQVRAWREMAQLLQVAVMTPQWAEALHKGGVGALSSLSVKTVAQLRTLFADARERDIIADVPDTTTRFAMIFEALQIDLTGMLVGTVVDRAGQPVAAAKLEIGTHTTLTDARGRFRLIRIPLASRQRLVISHEGHATTVVDDPGVVPHGDVVSLESYTLEAAAQGAATPHRLDEFDGDVLPPLVEFSMTTERRDLATLREGDVLILHKFFEGGTDALLATKFWAYEEGRFLVYTWKVPVDRLPAQAVVREHFTFRGGGFTRVRHGHSRMKMLLQLRRMRRAFRGRPAPQTMVEYDDALRARGEFLRSLSED